MGMANTFPVASTVIRRLKALGIDAIPSYHFSQKAGYYVAPGLAHYRGPTIQVQGDNQEFLTRKLAELLDENLWNIEETGPNVIRVNSIPKAARK